MEIHVHIDDRLVAFFRRFTRRRFQLGALALVGLGSIGVVYAQTMTEFQPGTVISSSAVNANFAALAERVSALETDVPGWGIVDQFVEVAADGFPGTGVTVVCGPGRRAVGGGYRVGTDARPFIGIDASAPSTTGDGWQLHFTNYDPAPGIAHTVHAFATCVNAHAAPL